MNNAVLMLCYDRTKEQYDLAVDALNSALAQDIPVDVYVFDNGSTYPKTREWLNEVANRNQNVLVMREETNVSPVAVANYMMNRLFTELNYPHILGIPDDVVIPPNAYRILLTRPEQIVTAHMESSNPPPIMDEVTRLHGDVHLAVPMVRKSAYDALIAKDGYYMDEGYFNYCSDCDLKLRIIDAGITTAQTDLRCWHYGGASHRLAPAGQRGPDHAGEDRAYFIRKWNFSIGSPEWDSRIAKINEDR
jgi:GT2 family glycosyltransferase